MCECCYDVVKRSAQRAAEKTGIRGEPIDIRIIALPLEPKASSRSVAVAEEKVRPVLEEAAAV